MTAMFEWKYEGGDFYIRTVHTNSWQRVKRAHITPARVKIWATLIEED